MNVVDSCGWLEYFSGGANASFFEPILHDTDQLIVPALTLFEVCRRVLAMRGEESARVVYRAMTVPQVVNLSPADHFAAAQSARRWKLAIRTSQTSMAFSLLQTVLVSRTHCPSPSMALFFTRLSRLRRPLSFYNGLLTRTIFAGCTPPG